MDTPSEARMPRPVSLVSHPATTVGPIVAITVYFERRQHQLWLRFVMEGDVDAVRWPAAVETGRAYRLWEATCFEVFVETPAGYTEFNLSPSGQWASFWFEGYRQGMADATEGVVIDGLDGAVDLVALEGTIVLPKDAGRMGLSTVVETLDGIKTYWALAHPSDKPDFHHADSFVLTLPAPEPA